MKKLLFPALLAAALGSLSLTSCGSAPDNEGARVAELPALPPAPGNDKNAKVPNSMRELNSVNATEDIKKMQPQM